MKKPMMLLAGLSVAAAVLPTAASAAPWSNINSRQANLETRINQGIRSGTLNRQEAFRLRSEFRGLVNLEARYRRGGLSMWERTDLNRRFDVLSAKIRIERHDRNDRRGYRR